MKSRLFWVTIVSLFLAFFVNIGMASASTNDFVISDFQADYYLDKDSEGRSTLKTVEHITAEFPSYDQNHGLERYLIKNYDGHSTNLSLISVKDENDNDLSYSISEESGNLILRIGDADIYVHGSQTYVIAYSQHDVTKFFSNTNDDEFYWDINGTNWSQQFDSVSARLHIGPGILNNLTGNMSCYFGASGSNDRCSTSLVGDVVTVTVNNLTSYENVTIAIGFKAHTFTQYQKNLLDIIKEYLFIILILVSLLLLGLMIFLRLFKARGALSKNAIIAEYLPPENIDIATSSIIVAKQENWFSATCIDLAVRHNIRIIEQKGKGLFSKTGYILEFLSLDGLNNNETNIIEAMFGFNPNVGSTYDLSQYLSNENTIEKLCTLFSYLQTDTLKGENYDLLDDVKTKMKVLVFFNTLLVIISFVFILIAGKQYIYAFMVSFISTFISLAIKDSTRAFSVKGRELHDYLKGLELYIKIAEEDRIRVLQSPRGAEKTLIDITDSKSLVRLYERVLPYAVLFGNEKEWAKVLGKYYEMQQSNPEWYTGTSIINSVALGSMLSGISSSATTNSRMASSGSSSSFGGSGGGGTSGGGGGGGGGGGW